MVPLPIGISFYTFQGISLVIDTYKEKTPKEYKYIPLYLSFFPQLVAGPIVKARDFLPQIATKYIKHIQWELATKQLITGYFLKMVVADNLSNYTAFMVYPYLENISSINLLALLFAYSLRIFSDFAGYSLIAMGIASLFGYRLPINFNYPYISRSLSEFWTRWHITLSSFLKEYLYFPLGGNKVSNTRIYVNLMLTMTLGGLWHGASWAFALWGIYHGLLLCTERILHLRNTTSLLSLCYVFILVTFGWLFFVFEDLSDIVYYLGGMCTQWNKPLVLSQLFYIALYSIPILGYYLIGLGKIRCHRHFITFLYASMLFFTLWNSGPTSPFVYFRF
jgi:alginate O-acetyltransferase complex protein AlgI